MAKDRDLTEEEFNMFLGWLSPDRERAALKYEQIRNGLIAMFKSRCCVHAEELADETINRVIRRAQEMIFTYAGDPTPYFYTVARNLYLEYIKKNPPAPTLEELPPPIAAQTDEESERIHECLEQCLQKLDADERQFILAYYKEDKRTKIEHRKAMAEGMGIKVENLRLQMFRIRKRLEECIEICLDQPPSQSD
jgi:RNA polymerase sigma factor (sigma-70 family)